MSPLTEPLDTRRFVHRFRPSPGLEQARCLHLKLPFPQAHLTRMHPTFPGDLVHRFHPTNRLKDDLR